MPNLPLSGAGYRTALDEAWGDNAYSIVRGLKIAVRYQVSGIRYQVSGIRYQVSGIWASAHKGPDT